MERNVASKWRVFAYDRTTGEPITGDADNITAILTLDNGVPAPTTDVNPTEPDPVDEAGYYDFNITADENNGKTLYLSPTSTTPNVQVVGCPPVINTLPKNFSGPSPSGGAGAYPIGHEPILLPRMLRQWAVYWPPAGNDDFGNATFDEPIQCRCRWEDVRELFIDLTGAQVTSSAKVYVDRDVKENGVLWLGVIDDLTSETVPFENENARLIRKFSKIPNFKASKVLREAML